MILDHQQASDQYKNLHPGIAAALDTLVTRDWSHVSEGKHVLDGDRLLVLVAQDSGRGREQARLEYHERYIDIQVALVGTDQMGWSPRSQCRQVAEPYDAGRDVAFYADGPSLWFPLHPEHFVIFFPGDAHAPLAGQGPVRKLVFKIAVAW